nr:protein kinase, ATP binding site-containing protein [Tanacetum cinerariifolium]
AETAYDCLNEERSRRPDIGEVVTRLEKALKLQLPPENRPDMDEPEGKVAGDRSFQTTGFVMIVARRSLYTRIAYLHNPGRTPQRVLHRDIKSSNILLDENWNARIADLGLSKFGPANQQYTFLVSNAVGTIGYCDPLYVETGLLTKESDVYSFGVVLFEMLCGRLCIGSNHDKRQPLTGLVRKCYEQKTMDDIIFGNIKDEINPHSLKAFTTIAYQCLMREQEQRPLMIKVVKVLESALQLQVSNVPPPPSLSPAEPLAS